MTMLLRLTIRDFVIVDRLELEFDAGFGALTGETGAGKSILVDALSLALGERADASVIRVGAERAEIAAEFEVAAGGPLESLAAGRRFRHRCLPAAPGDRCRRPFACLHQWHRRNPRATARSG
jgi:DNA repair ATPase RecN